MKFRVVLLPRAKQQLYNAALWWADNRSAEQALRWLEGFEQALAGLEYGPDRCPLARENDEFPVEIRQLLYGLRRKKTHRAVF